MGKTKRGASVRKEEHQDTIVIGGLHKDDYEWASKQYEALDYVFIGFVLDVEGYHWKAIYSRADTYLGKRG
jgi:hypothetical protein